MRYRNAVESLNGSYHNMWSILPISTIYRTLYKPLYFSLACVEDRPLHMSLISSLHYDLSNRIQKEVTKD